MSNREETNEEDRKEKRMIQVVVDMVFFSKSIHASFVDIKSPIQPLN